MINESDEGRNENLYAIIAYGFSCNYECNNENPLCINCNYANPYATIAIINSKQSYNVQHW